MSDELERRRRIRALRAKAASTSFPAEAEALRAKAEALEEGLPTSVGYEVYDETGPVTDGTWQQVWGFYMPTTAFANFGITITGSFVDTNHNIIRVNYTPPSPG